MNRELDATIRDSFVRRERNELLRSVPGAEKLLSTTLLAELPELGTIVRHEVAALVGVAPTKGDIGVLRGRGRVRVALYMGTLVATHYNPIINGFYERLIAKGKPR